MTTLLESEKKALIHQKFNPGEETESALQSRFSFLNTASKTITLCDWFLSLDLVKDIPEEACPDNPKKSATL